jgi:hypothetical protein
LELCNNLLKNKARLGAVNLTFSIKYAIIVAERRDYSPEHLEGTSRPQMKPRRPLVFDNL